MIADHQHHFPVLAIARWEEFYENAFRVSISYTYQQFHRFFTILPAPHPPFRSSTLTPAHTLTHQFHRSHWPLACVVPERCSSAIVIIASILACHSDAIPMRSASIAVRISHRVPLLYRTNDRAGSLRTVRPLSP